MTSFDPNARPTSINIFLADGTPDGLRVVEKSNWTGIALMCSRAQFDEVSTRPEFDGPCLYLLLAPSDEVPDRLRIYIGQSDEGRSRIRNHIRTKDFWTQIILFTSKDRNLNRAHVQYLESQLVQLARRTRRSELLNGNEPGAPKLSEPAQADMKSFLRDMLLIYPLLGVNAFASIEAQPRHIESDSSLLYLKGPDTTATAKLTTQGFLVFKGATGRLTPVESFKPYRQKFRDTVDC